MDNKETEITRWTEEKTNKKTHRGINRAGTYPTAAQSKPKSDAGGKN